MAAEELAVELVLVSDRSRSEVGDPRRDGAWLVELAQELFDALPGTPRLRLKMRGAVQVSEETWWEQQPLPSPPSMAGQIVLASFRFWVKQMKGLKAFGPDNNSSSHHVVPVLITGQSELFGSGKTATNSIYASDLEQRAVVVNGAFPSLPRVATNLARQLSILLGTDCNRNLETWSHCNLVERLNFNSDIFRSFQNASQSLPAPSCGNGLIDPGEECDCVGLDCDNCCDQTTCRLTAGAECTSMDSCCHNDGSCKLQSKGSICRSSLDADCDQEEVCTGTSRFCPPDIVASTGGACNNASGTCFAGKCMLLQAFLCIEQNSNQCTHLQSRDLCGPLRCARHNQDQHQLDACTDDIPMPIQVPDGTSCDLGYDGGKGANFVCKGASCVEVSLMQASLPQTCGNGIKDGLETDVDCGGSTCFPCREGFACERHSDCWDAAYEDIRCVTFESNSTLLAAKCVGSNLVASDGSSSNSFFNGAASLYACLAVVCFSLLCTACFLRLWLKRVQARNVSRNLERTCHSQRNHVVVPDTLRRSRARSEPKPKVEKKQKPNKQPDELFQWTCPMCSTANNGLMARCVQCNIANPADENSFQIDFCSDESDNDENIVDDQARPRKRTTSGGHRNDTEGRDRDFGFLSLSKS